MDKYFDLVDTVTVDLATKEVIRGSNRSYQHVQEERPQHVQEERPPHVQEELGEVATENTKREEQIEALFEILLELKKSQNPALNSNENSSNELVLNSDMVSPGCNFDKLGKVLGKGNSSKEVILVRDKVTGQELAYKTIMLAQFSPDEVRAWVSLADESMSPELYCFKLNGNKVEYFMEPLQGKTLQEIIDNGELFQDFKIAQQFALCVLDDLLKMYKKLTDNNFAHGDFHGGNVMLTHHMKVKLIDFGSARRLLSSANKSGMLENDIVGIIRMFCCLYSGVDFDDIFDAKKQLRGEDLNLSKLRDSMDHIPEAPRLEVFEIMKMLYDTVRDARQEGFGDTSQVAVYVQNKLQQMSPDKNHFLAKVAVILKLDGFKKQTTSSGSQMNSDFECDSVDGFRDRVSIWDDPEWNYLAGKVTIKDLQKLDEAVSFF